MTSLLELNKHSLYKMDENSANYYTDFILKWCSLMSSDKGLKLINLFKKNKFKPEYIYSLGLNLRDNHLN